MADAPFVIGSVAVDQDLLDAYAVAEFNSQLAEFSSGFGGALIAYPASPKVIPGNAVNKPRLTLGMAGTQLDLTNTGAVSSTGQPASVQGRGPVISRRTSIGEFFDHAIRGYEMTGDEIAAELGRQAGLQLAKEAKVAFYSAAIGALTAMSTSSHYEDETSASTKTLQLTDVFDAKKLMGDASSGLSVMVAHSTPWNSVEKDVLSGSYNLFNVGDMNIMTGLAGLKGMRAVIDDDVPTATVSAGTNYRTLLMGRGFAWIYPADRSPLITVTINNDKGAKAMKVSAEAHFAIGINGMDYDMNPANPTDAQLATSANWAEAFSDDHRDVKGVYILTQGG